MKAMLLEIDQGLVGRMWYCKHPRLRVWARPKHGTGESVRWGLLPGQTIPGEVESQYLTVDLEHAWVVREGNVELRLVEIEGEKPA